MTMEEVRVCLALAVAEHPSMRNFADHHGINIGNLSQVLSGARAPQLEHLALLGLRRIISFEPARSP